MASEESYKKIEGDWKDFRFRRIQPSDHSAVFEHIANLFLRDEILSKLLGWSQDFPEDINRVVEFFLQHGLSFLVEHRETGKIAGVRISFKNSTNLSLAGIPINSRQAKIIFKFIGELRSRGDVPNKYGINSWAEFYIASTSREFRNQGLAGELYNRSIEFLRASGYQHVVVVVTSPYTKQATKNRGFEQASRMDFDEVMDLEGKPAFKKEELNDDHFALLMVKKL